MDVWINKKTWEKGILLSITTVRLEAYSEDTYNEFMIRIIHEDSEGSSKQKDSLVYRLSWLILIPKGSFQARSAWIDYYKFIEHLASR